MSSINVGKVISFYEIAIVSGLDDTVRTMRVVCDGTSARELANEIEANGWMVKGLIRTDGMDLASALEYIRTNFAQPPAHAGGIN